jgi:uncharacterized C2H2 Zn-finger protein
MTIILDVECAPKLAYVWEMWKQNISQDMLLEHSYLMSASVKQLGSDIVYYHETRTEDDYGLVKWLIEWMDKADYIIAHNGKKFDIPLIKARAIINDIEPPSPYKVIDTLEIARKEFLFTRNTLENLALQLNCDLTKLKDRKFNGFKLWKECMDGNEEAWAEMKKYNILDVEVLEEVYNKLRSWDTRHPNINVEDDEETMRCPKCGSTKLERRGFYTTNVGKYQRYQCKSCRGWSSSRYTENSVEKRKSLLKAR